MSEVAAAVAAPIEALAEAAEPSGEPAPLDLNAAFEQVADKAATKREKKKGKKPAAAKAASETEEAPSEAGPENEPEAADDAEPTEDAEADASESAEPVTEAQITADQLFTDEALSTLEGIKRAKAIALFAKEALEKRAKKLDGFDIRIKRREKSVAGLEQEKQRLGDLARAFSGELQIISGKRASDQMGILRSLDKVSGGNGSVEAGRELFEALSMAYAREGKLPEKTRGELEVEQLRQQMARREQEWTERQRETEIVQTRHQIAQMEQFAGRTANNPASAPWISRYIAEGRTGEAQVGKWLGDLMEAEGLDLPSAIGILESRLVPPGTKPAPKGAPGAAPSKPRTNGAKPLTTVLPTAADASTGSQRALTQEELRARNARDPSFFDAWGLKHVAFPDS